MDDFEERAAICEFDGGFSRVEAEKIAASYVSSPVKTPLYPHQIRALGDLRNSLRMGHKRVMMQAPTGFGKSLTAAAIVAGARAKGKKVAFCVPALALIDQTVEAFFAEGIYEVGVIQAQHMMTDWSQPVQVCSVQTLDRRTVYPDANVVIIDEAHRWFGAYEKWMTSAPDTPFIGLSATPWTKGLGLWFDDLIIAATTRRLIDEGYLSEFEVYACDHPDLAGVKTVAGDYHEGQLSEAMNKTLLVANVVETWQRLGKGLPTLVFGVDRVHAASLHSAFEAAGVRSAYQDAFTEPSERREIARKFANGDLEVVCNIGTLTTGVDWDVRCIVLARPTKSEILYTQIIGRGLRTAPGKQACRILDHSDTTLRLGFVDDIIHTKLNDGSSVKSVSESKIKEPRECKKCGFVIAVGSGLACPKCGDVPERRPNVEQLDGELEKLERGAKAKVPAHVKEQFYRELLGYAADHGYNHGWAFHKYKEKYQVQPSNSFLRVALTPTPTTLSWIKSRQIAWAKSRAK